MAEYTVNYPYLPGKIKSLFFRSFSPEKRLLSLTVSEGTAYKDRNVYPVVTDQGCSVKDRFLVFTEYDYCYYIGLKKGIIVQKNGDWYKGRFDLRKRPVTGVLCRDGVLTFYLFCIPIYKTGTFFRTLLMAAIFGSLCYFCLPYLNILGKKNIFSKIKKKTSEKIEGEKPAVVNIDYSGLDPESPIEQWRPAEPLTGILGKIMQEGVDKYILGKKKFMERDYNTAYKLFSESSTAGFVPATYRMGLHFLNGSPDRKLASNAEYAKYFFRSAATKGHIPAQYQLAKCYLNGTGTAKNLKLAKYWGYKSAMSGFVPSQRLLGIILLEGNEHEKELARQWFFYAAYQDDHEAQYQLGRCYEKGIGGVVNRKKSLAWYKLSSENGNKKAGKAIKQLNRRRKK